MSIQAVPETGYVFSHWTGKSGATIPGLPESFTYIIEAVDTTFTAHFVPNQFYLNVLSSNPDWGTASPASGDQTFGTTITLSATPKLGYKFTDWSDGNTNSSRSYTIGASNATITANFAKADFPLTVNNDGHGNYTVGVKEQLIFPEIDYDKVSKVRGMDIVIVTTARSDKEAVALLEKLGMPFRK